MNADKPDTGTTLLSLSSTGPCSAAHHRVLPAASAALRGCGRRADFILIAACGLGLFPSFCGLTVGHPIGLIGVFHSLEAGAVRDRIWVYRSVPGNLFVLNRRLNRRIGSVMRFRGGFHRVIPFVACRVKRLPGTVRDQVRFYLIFLRSVPDSGCSRNRAT